MAFFVWVVSTYFYRRRVRRRLGSLTTDEVAMLYPFLETNWLLVDSRDGARHALEWDFVIWRAGEGTAPDKSLKIVYVIAPGARAYLLKHRRQIFSDPMGA
jgi:hypothetical protein